MGQEIAFLTIDTIPTTSQRASIYRQQILELAEIRNPSLSSEDIEGAIVENLKKEFPPIYVYYPWRNITLECVPEKIFIEIKTNRNQLLISKEEQTTLYYDTSISIAGMSVGSSILYGLVGTGISKNITIADFDDFSTSNLNRVQATILDVGKNKALVAKQKALEMNPFLNISSIEMPITTTNLNDFITHETRIIFEEIDDFKMKVLLRKYAKKNKIAYVMLTNLGDGVLADIERYDSEDIELFNANVDPSVIDEIEKSQSVSTELMKKLSVSLVDKDMISERAHQTLHEIGKSLVGRPQLYSTVALDGGIAPYIARRIIIDSNLKSGRYKIDLKASLDS